MAINPEYLAAFQHYQAGRLDVAEQSCRQVLAEEPKHADALHLMGLIAYAKGQQIEAIQFIDRAIDIDGLRPTFYNNLGNILQEQGQVAQAIESYRRALQLAPGSAAIRVNFGNVLQLKGMADEAIDVYQKAIEADPTNAAAHFGLGNVLRDRAKPEQACDCYRRAIELNPDFAEAHTNLGNVLRDQGQLDEAVACYDRALQLAPNDPIIYGNLAAAMRLQERIGDAVEFQRRALSLNPQSAELQNDLGGLVLNQGKIAEAIGCYREALALKPQYVRAASNLLIALQYCERITPAQLLAAHAEFEHQHAAPLRNQQRPHDLDRNPDRPIVVGFVSPNFRQHAVGHFVIRALENFDKRHCQIVCYSDGSIEDEWTRRFRTASAVWRQTAGLSDAELADQMRADRIDILFDLAGHTAQNRLLVFARKPAPIQITWADYVGTTGLTAIDYILGDRWEIPLEAEKFYTERVLRMPQGYVCYDPPPYAPPVSSLPALQRGLVTFGSFNFRPKMSPAIVEIWARILLRVPNSRLVLKYRALQDASVSERLLEDFRKHGVDDDRIQCLGWSPHRNLLAEYQRIDVALDPLPYNGGLTTCEAMWMGVPVVTCPGETFASRHSLSHLSNVGLTETIARDLDDYVGVAVSLATDLPRLAALRSSLRHRMAVSPLCDGKRFAEDLMQVLINAWREYCRR